MSPKLTKLVLHISFLLLNNRRQSERGYILFLVMGVMFVMQALLMAYIVVAKIEKSTTEASVDSNTSFYGAEGGLNLRAEQLRRSFLNTDLPKGQGSATVPGSTADCLDDNPLNDGNEDFKCTSTNIASKNVITYINDLNPKNSINGNPVPRKTKIPAGEVFEDLDAQEYRYKIVADAQNKDCGDECSQESKQEMLIKIRYIPLFQFAAFYQDDLEFHPGSKMVINGPVHSNSSIYFGAQQADPENLKIIGQVSAAGNAYSRRKSNNTIFSSDRSTLCQSDPNIAEGTNCQSLYDGNYTGNLLSFIDPTYIKNRWGNRLKVGVKNVKVPQPSFLNVQGDYYGKADVRIQFKPTATTIPFAIQAVKPKQGESTILPINLSTGQLQSLRQPVMTNFCNSFEVEPTNIPVEINTPESKEAIAKGLRTGIASIKINAQTLKNNELSLPIDQLYSVGSGKLHSVKDNIIATLTGIGLSNASATSLWDDRIKSWTLKQVAGLKTSSFPNGGCFVPPPIDRSDFYNSREDRSIKLLQLNVASLTIWNKDGIYVEFNANDPSDNNQGKGFSASQTLFALYDADDNPNNGIQSDNSAVNNSFQKLGYAAADRSEGGLVIHATVDPTAPNAETNQSPYGFAVLNGKELPGLSITSNVKDPTGLTIASDQAIYLQGDYNTVNKQPAAILSDSINVLSNKCLDVATTLLNCGNLPKTAGLKTTREAPYATETAINAAFLSGTDVSKTGTQNVPNGGLHNYPRLHEIWRQPADQSTYIKLKYRGSMVSLGSPLRVNGAWTDNQDWAYKNPDRDYQYDTDFNTFENLPPLSPNLVYMRQEVFSRKFLR